MTSQLAYLSDKVLAQLRNDVSQNLDRYLSAGFDDFATEPGWDVPLGIEFDDGLLATLDLSRPPIVSAIDLKNSRIVGQALSELTPSIANEERVWARLAHVEAIGYSRARWLTGESPDKVEPIIRDHFFAPTQTGIRDDQALSRLWWNYFIAKTCDPDDPDGALQLILKSADIRSNFVERIWMTSRRRIAAAVLRAMRTDPWITTAEENFRKFMKALNRLGGGIVFETLADGETDIFVAECVVYAEKQQEPA